MEYLGNKKGVITTRETTEILNNMLRWDFKHTCGLCVKHYIYTHQLFT